MRAVKSCMFLGIVAGFAVSAMAQSTINTTNKWAWSSGAGWINCRTDSTNGAIMGEYVCSGYWYSPTAGWIHLGNGSPSNGVYYATNSASDYGVNHDGKGHLSGYAWCASFGWINFGWTNNPDASDAPKVDLKTGVCSGYAWGGSLGWIGLSNMSAYLETDLMSSGADANSNGIPDAWEIAETGSTNLNILSPTNDYDGDTFTDYEEYIAGTSPTNRNDFLSMAGFSWLSGTNLQLAWSSKETRLYRVEKKNNLFDNNWVDSGFGLISSDSESNTVRQLPIATQAFYRIKAVLPLSQ
jgi:hypothetical protein